MRFSGFFKPKNGLELRYPIQPAPRVAVFDPRYAGGSSVVVVPREQVNDLDNRRVDTVAATADLLSLVAAVNWRPSHPLIVFSTPNQRLSDHDRDRLWRQFEVPIFEQVMDPSGELLASECEAHSGLHLEGGREIVLPGTELTRDLCGCGRSGARLLPIANHRPMV